MALADSAQSYLSYVVESSYGTTPGSPSMLNLRHTQHDLVTSKNALLSEEKRSDRQRVTVRHGQKNVSATIQCELSYQAQKDWVRAALGYDTTSGSFTSTAGTDTAFTNSTSKITRTSGSWVTDGALVGMKIRITGSADNDGVVTITAVSALEITTEETLTDEAASADVKMQGEYAELGTTKTSFSVEAGFGDITQYEVFTGVVPSGFSLEAQPDQMVSISFPVVGKESSFSGSTLDSAVGDVNTADPVDTYSAGSAKVLEGGSASALIMSFSLNVENSRAPDHVLGDDSAVNVSMGMAAVSGSIRAYFQDAVLLNKFLNETESSLEMGFQDADGNEFHVELFAIKYTGGERDVSGEDTLELDLPFAAYRDTTSGDTLRINMIPATAT